MCSRNYNRFSSLSKIIIILILFLFACIANSQVKFNQSKPISLGGNSPEKEKIAKKVKKIDKIKKKNLEGLDFVALKKEIDDLKQEDPDFSMIAKGINKKIDILKEGEWEENEDGSRICRYHLHVENSLSLILAFEKFYIPEGSELYIFDPEGDMVMGPLTSLNNKKSEKFMTGMIKGPDVIFELYENTKAKNKAKLVIIDIGVGVDYNKNDGIVNNNKNNNVQVEHPPVPYELFRSDYHFCQGYLGSPASCINRDINKSVGVWYVYVPYEIGDNRAKKGYFIGKTVVALCPSDSSDCNVYLLTVGHVIPDNYINNDRLIHYSTTRFNWIRIPANIYSSNFQSCEYLDSNFSEWNKTIKISETVDYNGTELLVLNRYYADLALLKMMAKPIHNLYLAGWNAWKTQTSTVLHCVGAFQGDPLRYGKGILTEGGFSLNEKNMALRITCKVPNEGGGSGSALFNSNLQVIGAVSSPADYDNLSKLFHPNIENRLKYYLAPNSTDTSHNGRYYFVNDSNFICNKAECCELINAEIGQNMIVAESNRTCLTYINFKERFKDVLCDSTTYYLDLTNLCTNDKIENIPLILSGVNDSTDIPVLNQLITMNLDEYKWRNCEFQIDFKDSIDGTIINTCIQKLTFKCRELCECGRDAYDIRYVSTSKNGTMCCFDAIISLKDSTSNPKPCEINAIFPWVMGEYNTNQTGYTNYAYSDSSSVFINGECVIHDICIDLNPIDKPKNTQIRFEFYQGVALENNEPKWSLNEQYLCAIVDSIPKYCSNCCESYEITPVLDQSTCNLHYNIISNDSTCTYDSVSIDAYYKVGYEYIFIDHLIKANGNIIYIPREKNLQNKISYYSNVIYRFTFYNSAGDIICYKETIPPNCLYNGGISVPPSSNCCKDIVINNLLDNNSNYYTYAKVVKVEYDILTGMYVSQSYNEIYRGSPYVTICADDYYSAFYVEFYDSTTNNVILRIPFLVRCPCCSEESLNFNINSGPDCKCCYTFNLEQEYGTSSCDSVKWVKYSKVGEEYNPEQCPVGDRDNPYDLSNLNLCNNTEETQRYYFEFFTDETLSDSSKRICYKVIELEPCSDTCRAVDINFNVIVPDSSSCCYHFDFSQSMSTSTCDSVTHYQTTKVGEIGREMWGLVYGGISLNTRYICNESDSTEQYYFEFFSDNSYSEGSKVCSRLVSLDPCIDTAAVCCEQVRLNIDLIKEGCPDGKCMIVQSWDIPDPKYTCFQQLVFEDDTISFTLGQLPPVPFAKPCLDLGERLTGSVSLLRFEGDPNPCIVNYDAYCPVGEIRQGCNPDSCNDDWENKVLINQSIDSGACTGCLLTIFYKHRKTCGNWQDLQILDMELTCPDSILCNSSADEIYQLAVKMVISQNDMDFEPKWTTIEQGGDTCNIQWRISQVSCWTDYFVSNVPIEKIEKDKDPTPLSDPDPSPWIRTGWTIYEPCNEDCCARRFEVCRYDDSTVTIKDLGPLSGTGDCDTVYSHSNQCYNVCDFLKDFDELSPKIPIIHEPELEGSNILDTLKSVNDNLLLVYFDQMNFKVLLNNTESSIIDISIYNFTGRLTINKTQHLISGRNLIELDISSFISGVYTYSITSDGILFKTGKFYVIR